MLQGRQNYLAPSKKLFKFGGKYCVMCEKSTGKNATNKKSCKFHNKQARSFSNVQNICMRCPKSVLHSSLTKEQQGDLERVQKSSLKVIVDKNYKYYENECEDLSTQRKGLCLQFAKKCLYNNEMKTLFPRSSRKSKIATRL